MIKKSFLQLSIGLIALISLVTINSCKKDNPDPVPVLSFASTTLACQIGSTSSCTNVATSSIPAGGAITYISSNTAVATVNTSNGAITLVGGGTTTITASQAVQTGKNAAATTSYTLTVTAPDPTPTLTFAAGPMYALLVPLTVVSGRPLLQFQQVARLRMQLHQQPWPL